MNYNHHPRNRECNEIHYNPLSGDRSDHQRRKVISGFPRLADDYSPNDTVLLVAVLPIPDQATGGESRCNEASNLLSDPGSFFLPCNPVWSELSVGGGGHVQFSKTLRREFLYLPIFRRSSHHLEGQETQVLYIIVQLSQPSYYSKISVYS